MKQASGNITTATGEIILEVSGKPACVFGVSGTYAGLTASFKGLLPGSTNWHSLRARRTDSGALETGPTTQTNTTRSWRVDSAGFSRVKILASALSSGTVAVEAATCEEPGVQELSGPPSVACSASDVHAPASNTAAVVTYAAGGAGVKHLVSGVAWSYSGDPTGGNLKIEDGSGTTVFSLDVTKGGPGFFEFPRPKIGSDNTAMIVTLAAGGAGISGKVSVINHWTE